MMLISPLSSRITNSHGPKVTLMFGAIVVAIGYGIGIFAMHSIWELIVIAVIIGAGTGMAYGAMPALIMGAVPPSETGAANSFNTLMRLPRYIIRQRHRGCRHRPDDHVPSVGQRCRRRTLPPRRHGPRCRIRRHRTRPGRFPPLGSTASNSRKEIGSEHTDTSPTTSKESVPTH